MYHLRVVYEADVVEQTGQMPLNFDGVEAFTQSGELEDDGDADTEGARLAPDGCSRHNSSTAYPYSASQGTRVLL